MTIRLGSFGLVRTEQNGDSERKIRDELYKYHKTANGVAVGAARPKIMVRGCQPCISWQQHIHRKASSSELRTGQNNHCDRLEGYRIMNTGRERLQELAHPGPAQWLSR